MPDRQVIHTLRNILNNIHLALLTAPDHDDPEAEAALMELIAQQANEGEAVADRLERSLSDPMN
jgi:hypothetical protein